MIIGVGNTQRSKFERVHGVHTGVSRTIRSIMHVRQLPFFQRFGSLALTFPASVAIADHQLVRSPCTAVVPRHEEYRLRRSRVGLV